jgi:ATP-dependent helicase/nuclease subunit B
MINKSQHNNDTIIIIVPEQFTLQAQKDIINMNKAKGIMNIEVLSFQRLAYRIIDDLKINGRALLKDTGKGMIIRKIVNEYKDNFAIISKNINKKGYVNELKSLITEYFQYNIKEEQLEKSIDGCKQQLLKEKLKDTKILFEAFKNYIDDKYITTESTLDLLSNAIKDNEFLKDKVIFIDGFYGFTPLQYKIMKELMIKVSKIYVSVTFDCNEDYSIDDESNLYYESKKTISKIRNIGKEENILEENSILMDDEQSQRFKSNPSLYHLQKNLYRYPYKIYREKVAGLYMCQASNVRKEVKYVADSIMKLLMEKNYRYKDIAVVTGDLEGYEHIVKHTFYEYNIPFFIDRKKTIMTNPLVELIISVLDINIKNYKYESIFTYIKTGLLSIQKSDIDLLENYVLAYGIRGKRRWNDTWEMPYPLIKDTDSEYAQTILENINKAKEELLLPLNEFAHKVHKNKDVKQITKAIYELLDNLSIEELINNSVKKFENNNELILQKEYSQIYKIIIELLDQIVDILGSEELSLKEYKEVLEAGLMQCEMGIVPPSLDQVVIGDLERSRIGEVRALFVIGINEGKIPKVINKPNLITDPERQTLLDLGIEIAPDNKINIFKEQFNIFMGLLKTREKLYLSFSRADATGKSTRPSMLFLTIRKMFQNIEVLDVDMLYDNKIVVNRPKPTFTNVINKIKEIDTEDDIYNIKDIYTWYKYKPIWNEILVQSLSGKKHSNGEDKLSEQASSMLYGDKLHNSVSRLELFAKCPFAHFINYGLKANERLEYSISMPDIGMLFHKAIEEFSVKLSNRNLDWKDIDNEYRDSLVEEVVKEIVARDKRSIYYSNNRNEYILNRLIRITKRAIWAISYQISKGDFRPAKNEYIFNNSDLEIDALNIDFGNNKSMKLSGIIDRVDEYQDGDNLYVTVVDYKSGNQKFDMVALYYGLQMQLFVYLNAVTELNKSMNKKVIPAGVFYFRIHDPIIKTEGNIDKNEVNQEIKKEMKLRGLVIDDINIIKKIDNEFTSKSDVLPVTITSKGNISKNSSIMSQEDFEKLQCYVKDMSKELGKKIIEGDISINPYKKNDETGCDYCNYLPICQFDSDIDGNKYRYLKNIDLKNVLSKIDHDIK